MPSSGIFELSGITGGTGAVRSDDVLPLVDVHDATQAAQGSLIKITLAQLYRTETTAVTVSTPLPDIAQKWNAGGVTFTAVKLNVTDTASAAGSLLLDLQVGAASKFSVTKAGAVTQAAGLTVTTGGVTVSVGTTAVQALTATTGVFSSTLSTTTLTASTGLVVTSGDSASLKQQPGTATMGAFIQFINTGGTLDIGLDNSTASLFGTAGNYGTAIYRPVGTAFAISRTSTVDLSISTSGVVTAALGLVVTTGGLTVSAGTTAVQALTATTGVFAGAVSGVTTLAIGGALSGVTTLNASGLATLGAGIALTGSLTFATAVGKIVPGATSISHRNNADSADNLLILDAGDATFRTTLYVQGNVGIGVATPTVQTGLSVQPTLGSNANGSTTMYVGGTHPATSTSSGTGLLIKLSTAASAFTMTTGYGLYIQGPSKGAGSAITTAYGLYMELQQAGTTNYAIYCQSNASSGAVTFRDTALATTATVGHLFIPTSAGAPTGVPATIPTGQVAFQYDSTNNKLYVYNGAWKSTAALT